MSWLNLFWNSDIEGVSREGRYIYLYLLGKANALGTLDYYLAQFLLDTGCEEAELEVGLQELIQVGLLHSTGDCLILTRYVWNRRTSMAVMEEARRLYNELPAYRKTDLKLIPLQGLEYVLKPEKSAFEKRYGFAPEDIPTREMIRVDNN